MKETLNLGKFCKYFYFVLDSISFWIRRYERDFGHKFQCNDRTKAKDSYILMHEIWDRENDCFDIGLRYKGMPYAD